MPLPDPIRIAILWHLAGAEHAVIDLRDHLGGSQANISRHIARLKQTGLVAVRRSGRQTSID